MTELDLRVLLDYQLAGYDPLPYYKSTLSKRNDPNMDYSVGGPLWQEWQRLQTHSEWDRWKDLYKGTHPKLRWQVYFDWLLENDFPLEAQEVRVGVIEAPADWMEEPNWIPTSVSEDPNSEPVEGAA